MRQRPDIGFQAHLTLARPFPAGLESNLRRFVALGLDVAFTEVDVRMPLPANRTKLAAQADAFARLLHACLAVPRCVSFTIWGAGDAYSWVPQDPDFPGEGAATPFDADLRPKPAYGALARALGGS